MVASKERVKMIPIADVANAWGVSEKAIKNWVEFVYQAFDVLLPGAGPYPEWGVDLLNITGKHVSEKASFYFAETGESRRLKSAEFIRKIRKMRLDGHFQEFQKFQNSRMTQAEVDEDEAVAGMAAITRGIDQEVERAKAKVDQYATKKMDELGDYIDRTPLRMLGMLGDRMERRSQIGGVNDVIDVTYSRVELPEVSEVLELPEGA